jgi:hypothetical protein
VPHFKSRCEWLTSWQHFPSGDCPLNVLFYGGCHAPALERLFRAAAIGWHRFASLKNYELINAGKPFPYGRLKGFDAVVYSPIRNKSDWNTSHLVERCAEQGILTLSFPWLQWNGYFPGVVELEGRAPHLWSYNRFVDGAAEGGTAAYLLELARSAEAFSPLPHRDWSLSILEEHEAGVDLPISSFVRANYKAQRLFWTPNHPTLPLYRFVMQAIAERLGIRLKRSPHLKEPHKDSLIILPGVAEALELTFAGGDYRPEVWKHSIGLEDFIGLNLELFGPAPAEIAATP